MAGTEIGDGKDREDYVVGTDTSCSDEYKHTINDARWMSMSYIFNLTNSNCTIYLCA